MTSPITRAQALSDRSGTFPVVGAIAPRLWGRLPGGDEIYLVTLVNRRGMLCEVSTYGASIIRLLVPDRQGAFADVVLGYDSLEDYLAGDDYFGATIGRVANRIAGAKFKLHGHSYRLTANEGSNHLHGGRRGFDKVAWNLTEPAGGDPSTVRLRYCSGDGEEGYPGNVEVVVTYHLSAADELEISYQARTDRPTLVNLTNHTYFNLAGSADILDHELMVNASRHTPFDPEHIPTGIISPVAGTPCDFSAPTLVRSRFERLTRDPRGFNHNYVLNDNDGNGSGGVNRAARLRDPKSGRALELWTDQPGLQLYTGQYVRPYPRGKNGLVYGRNAGLCLEPQHFPNAMNVSEFPSPALMPGEKYSHETIWKFSVD